jgi:hypothetical protein
MKTTSTPERIQRMAFATTVGTAREKKLEQITSSIVVMSGETTTGC